MVAAEKKGGPSAKRTASSETDENGQPECEKQYESSALYRPNSHAKCPNKSLDLTSVDLSELNPGRPMAQSTEQSGPVNEDNLDAIILDPLVTIVPPTQNPSQYSDSSIQWTALMQINHQVSSLPQILTVFLL